MLLKEAQDKLNEAVKKVNLICNAGKPPEGYDETVFCEYLIDRGGQLVFTSDLNIGFKIGASIDFREVQETNDLTSLVFKRSRIALGHLTDKVEGYLDCLEDAMSTLGE